MVIGKAVATSPYEPFKPLVRKVNLLEPEAVKRVPSKIRIGVRAFFRRTA